MSPAEACDVIESALRLTRSGRHPKDPEVSRMMKALEALEVVREALATDRNATEAWPSV